MGVDHVVLGHLERRTRAAARGRCGGSPAGRHRRSHLPEPRGRFTPPDDGRRSADLDSLPFPAWDLFPLENYWKLGYAHAPFTTRRYLALLTSRGCPFDCGFCITPEVSSRRWTARSAENVADEIQAMRPGSGSMNSTSRTSIPRWTAAGRSA